MKLQIELTEKQAWDLAQYLKRLSYSDVEAKADPARPDEPYDMQDALGVVECALSQKGYAPR